MTREEAYEEALRRIREAEKTGAVELDLSGMKDGKVTELETLTRLPPELECLTSLQELNLYGCIQLNGDLSPLAGLTSLHSLNLRGCKHLRDLSPLASLISLRSLKLLFCDVDLSPLAGTSLHSLGLSGQFSDLSPLANLTSLQSLDLSSCMQLSDLSPLAGLTSLQSLNLYGCEQLSDLSPLANLVALQTLDLTGCKQLTDLSPLAGLASLQKLNLTYCFGVRRFAPLKSLLPTLKQLNLYRCKLDDLPSWGLFRPLISSYVCGKHENVLDKFRTYYGDRSPVSSKDTKPLATPPQIFVSYAWGNISPNATVEDHQRQEVVERLCRKLEQERWHLIRDKGALDYGDQISAFMKTLGQAHLVIVVLSKKYLRSPYCMTELYSVYQNARQEKGAFLKRIIPLVLKDANIGDWRGRATYAEHWETEFKAMEQHFTHLGVEDLKLYKAMRRWHNEVGDMLAYVNDVLSPHGFEDIVKDDFVGLRQMLQRHR